RALQKEPADRYASAGALLQDLVALSPTPATRAGTAVMIGAGAPDPARRKWLTAIAAVLVVAIVGGWFAYRNARARWARTTALPQIAALINKEQFAAANRLLRQIEPYMTDDPEFVKLRSGFLLPTI